MKIATLVAALIGAALLYAPGLAHAQATRTWVSSTGDDINPCSRTSPCKTFAGAFSKTADCGEIDALDPGGYGTITITRGVTIDGGGGESGQVASIASGGTPGVTVNNSSTNCPKVVIRNLDIQSVGGASSGTIGIRFLAGGALSVEHVHIWGFSQQCISMQPAVRAGLEVINSDLECCNGGGIVSSAGTAGQRVSVVRSTIHRNGGVGVTSGANSYVHLYDSAIVANAGGGLLVNNATGQLGCDQCTVSNNQIFGVHATSNGIIELAATSVQYNNGTGLLADPGSQILTWSNNWVAGNVPDGSRTGTITPQ